MLQRFSELSQQVDLTAARLERLLDDYGLYVDTDQAHFLKGYLRSLQLDFEMAMTRGEESHLQLILEDVGNLLDDASVRLKQSLK
ncbi:hypothetical protein BH24DEI2_BH24DEI2_15960 [soil metagenome]